MIDIIIFFVIQELSVEQKREELQKYGIFFDDEYDYLQYLKDVNEVYELEEYVLRENKVRYYGMLVCDSNIYVVLKWLYYLIFLRFFFFIRFCLFFSNDIIVVFWGCF